MKLKKYLYILLSLLYLDLVFNLFMYDNYLRSSIINIFLFTLCNAGLICIVTSVFNEKVNKIIVYCLYTFLFVWYGLYYVFYQVLLTPFSVTLLKQTDQVLKFGKNIVISILQNIHVLILFALPLVLLIVFRKKIKFEKEKLKYILIYLSLFVLAVGIYIANILIQGKEIGSIYNLYFENNNVSLNIERLGVMPSTILDVERLVFGFNEKIVEVDKTHDNELDTDEIFEYDYNTLDIDFSKTSGGVGTINKYIANDTGTKKNRYTGMFEGKNLVFIVAESFSEIAVSEKYTPTLYKLVHEGFFFENFYTSNNLSTIGGEFQALTGLYADNTILGSWRSGSAYYPYGLGNLFKGLGYNTYAYHNNSAYFQDRNVYLNNLGFNNYQGCYNGLEKRINCNTWPQSDIEMMSVTSVDYINSDKPFMVYYMTVSGHFYYTYNENGIALKNRKLVDDLDYPEAVRGYIATQIELDRALETLMEKLDEANKLDDTVFVLLADHYPYNLPIEYINMLSTYKRDSLIEANSNNLIIYNKKMKKVKIDKVGMSIDVLPTVLNLFGVDYDSRIIMGKDILSNTEGIAIFKDKSWVTNKGTYHAATGKFVAKEEVADDYVNKINSIVNNRVAISRMIVENNYYKAILK